MVSLPSAFSHSSTSSNQFHVNAATNQGDPSRFMSRDFLRMPNAMLLPHMFPTSILKDPQSMKKTFPSYKFDFPDENVKNSSNNDDNQNIENQTCPSNAFTNNNSNNSISSASSTSSNCSFDKNSCTLSDAPEDDIEKEKNEQIEEKRQEIDSKTNGFIKRKRSSTNDSSDLHAFSQYTELLHEQYKSMLPWLISQWQANGSGSMVDFWKKIKDSPKEFEKFNLDTKMHENFEGKNRSKRMKTEPENDSFAQEKELSKIIPNESGKALRKSRSVPSNLNNLKESPPLDKSVSESFSDPGKQSPISSEDDESVCKSDQKSNDKKENLIDHHSVDSYRLKRVSAPARNSNPFSLLSASKMQTNTVDEERINRPFNHSFISSYKQTDYETTMNKETSTNISGGEIHGGVWIPTRSRNCHLCGKEFKNVYR